MSIGKDFVGDVITGALGFAQEYRDLLREQFADATWKSRLATDLEHFAKMTQLIEADPLFLPALAMVEGGLAEIRRYERTGEALKAQAAGMVA